MEDLIANLLKALVVGENPTLPRVPPNEVVTGLGPSIDRLTPALPPNLRQRLADLAANKRVKLGDMPYDTNGQYDPWSGVIELPERALERAQYQPESVATTLAHETQHSRQSLFDPQRPVPFPARLATGDAYTDNLKEIEARYASRQIDLNKVPQRNFRAGPATVYGTGLPK